MASETLKLTERAIKGRSVPEGASELLLWDVAVPGLGARIFASGARSFILQYRNDDNRTRRTTLGKVRVLPLAKARDRARELLVKVAAGEDPSADRAARRSAPTMSELVERYRSEHLPRKKASSQREDSRLLDHHILPRLGGLKAASVSFSDVESLHRSLGETPYQGNRVLALTSKLLALAEAWGWREQNTNVAQRVGKYPERRRHRVLSEIELARLGTALAEMEAEGANPYAIGAIRMLALTGLRRGEVLALQWRDVDLERGFLSLRDSKTGPRSVPLSGPAAEVLASLERQSDNAHCFPGRKPGGHMTDLQKPWRAVRRRARLEGLRIHDLRHGLASAGLGTGLPLAAVGRLLGHRSAATTSRYAEFCDDPARAAADQAAQPIAQALAAGERAARRGES